MGRRLALLIGNGEYEDPHIERLTTPPRDVQALAGLLQDPSIGGFDEATTLVDETESRIRRAVSAFFRDRKRDDLLLLYFSGHGLKDDRGRLYWATRDTVPDDLAATAVPASYVSEHMDQSRSKRQIVVLDCCYSGAFAAGAKGGARAITRETFEGTGFGRVVLTASDSMQYAMEGDRVVRQVELSLFTHYLIEGLSTGGAARPGSDVVTLDEWYEYAYEQVIAQRPSQTPCKWGYNQQGEIVIARNPRRVPRSPAELPAELAESVADPRPWVRLAAVQELMAALGMPALSYAPAARQALEQLRADDSQRVREAAEGAVRALVTPNAPPPVEAEAVTTEPAVLEAPSATPGTETPSPTDRPASSDPAAAAAVTPTPAPHPKPIPPPRRFPWQRLMTALAAIVAATTYGISKFRDQDPTPPVAESKVSTDTPIPPQGSQATQRQSVPPRDTTRSNSRLLGGNRPAGSMAAAIVRNSTTPPSGSATRLDSIGRDLIPGPTVPAVDRSAADAAIRTIVARQKKATETRDLELALADLTPALERTYRPKVIGDFRSLAELRDITSTITALEVDVRSATQARARFNDVLTGVRRRNAEKLVLFDGTITYDLTQVDGRWAIAAISAVPQR